MQELQEERDAALSKCKVLETCCKDQHMDKKVYFLKIDDLEQQLKQRSEFEHAILEKL